MAKCKHETKNGRCGLKESYAYRKECYTEECCRCHEPIEPCGRNEPMTNADRIRANLENDEELAALYVRYNPYTDMYHTDAGVFTDFVSAMDAELEWLKQPAEGETT